MNKKDLKFIIKVFFSWRIFLLVLAISAPMLVSLQEAFLGGRIINYQLNPLFWSLANFDGQLYLTLAKNGYEPFTYFFFPLYPLLIRMFNVFGQGVVHYLVSGVLVSHISFFVALVGLWKLIKLDYKRNIAVFTLILLLIFPTSFYFGSVYTESLFLATSVWSFYFARKRRWLLAGVLGGFATLTRLVGLAIFPALLVEYYLARRSSKISLAKTAKGALPLFLIPLALLGYMLFLKMETGDPLEFLTNISMFGAQRSSTLILLPQVFYRYIFKILPNINYSYFPIVFTTLLEFTTSLLFLFLSVYSLFKLRLSYSIYLVLGYLIPTLSGSFSSLPRYVLVLFPGFILLSKLINKRTKFVKFLIYSLFMLSLIVATSLFIRGYWIS